MVSRPCEAQTPATGPPPGESITPQVKFYFRNTETWAAQFICTEYQPENRLKPRTTAPERTNPQDEYQRY
jgi:hypothetical protein